MMKVDFFALKFSLSSTLQKFWTGSKRIGHNSFIDENGLPLESLGCFFYQHARNGSREDIFQFPSEMTAHVSQTGILWQNSVPGMKTTKTRNSSILGHRPKGQCLCYKRFVFTLEFIILFVGLFLATVTALTILIYLLTDNSKLDK